MSSLRFRLSSWFWFLSQELELKTMEQKDGFDFQGRQFNQAKYASLCLCFMRRGISAKIITKSNLFAAFCQCLFWVAFFACLLLQSQTCQSQCAWGLSSLSCCLLVGRVPNNSPWLAFPLFAWFQC